MEKFDIYNVQKEKTGYIGIRGVPLQKGQFRFTVAVLIFDSKAKKLLIQKRVHEKHLWPDYWDFSAAGGVEAGESLAEAAGRELYEELGIEADFSNTSSRLTMSFCEGWNELFIVKKDLALESLHLQKEEVAEVRWVNENELKVLVDRGEFIPYMIAKDIFKYARTTENYER